MLVSRHAEARMQQRAVNDDVVTFIKEQCDAEIYLGRGTWACRVTDRLADDLLNVEVLPAPRNVIEKARGVALLLCEDGADILVTVVNTPELTGFNAYTRRPKGRVQRFKGSSRARRQSVRRG